MCHLDDIRKGNQEICECYEKCIRDVPPLSHHVNHIYLLDDIKNLKNIEEYLNKFELNLSSLGGAVRHIDGKKSSIASSLDELNVNIYVSTANVTFDYPGKTVISDIFFHEFGHLVELWLYFTHPKDHDKLNHAIDDFSSISRHSISKCEAFAEIYRIRMTQPVHLWSTPVLMLDNILKDITSPHSYTIREKIKNTLFGWEK